MLSSDANPAIKHPLHLFLLNDSTLYLGTHHYLCKVDSVELTKVYYNADEKSVIRSVVQHNDTTFFSVQNHGIYYIGKDYTDIHSTPFSRNESTYWSMCTFNHQLVVSGHPRKIAFYDTLEYGWKYSFDLIQNAQGTIFQIEQHGHELFATLYEGGVFKWEHDKWIAINKGLPEDLRVRGIIMHHDKQLVASDHGIYYRKSNSNAWKPANGDLNDVKISEIISDGNSLIATGVDGELFISNDEGIHWNKILIENAQGYIIHSAAIMKNKLYLSAESTNTNPSGVFTIPLTDIRKHTID